MDRYSGKRAIGGGVLLRKGSGHVFKDAGSESDQNPQLCNRIGCNGRVASQRGAHTGCSEKGKSPRPSLRSSSSGKEAIGTSSKAYCSSSNPRKSLTAERKTLNSHLETGSSETSSLQDEPEGLELIPPPDIIQRRLPAKFKNVASRNASITGSTVASNVSSRGNLNERTGHSTNVGSNKSGSKNFRSNSISFAIPPGCSSSESNLNRRKDIIIKKRNAEGGISSSRGKKIIDSASEVRNAGSRNGISVNEIRRSGNTPPNGDNAVSSARTRRTNKGHTRARFSSQGNESSNSSSNDTTLMNPDDLSSSSLSLHLPSENSTGHPNSLSRPGSSSERICNIIPTGSGEVSITRSSVNPDNIRGSNIDGFTEAWLAFERMEQELAPSHNQRVVLEPNFYINSLTFYDHHQDLRLDIDNMTYEELLALEERMGTVSTALAEEILAESLKKSICQSSPSDEITEGCDGDNADIKCSICQEEYMEGDEVGNLRCEHRYHVVCVQKWLRLKNWCPICKAPAARSRSVPLSSGDCFSSSSIIEQRQMHRQLPS